MRVLAIGNAYPPHHLGGYEVIWQGVTDHLRRHGHATRVLTTGLQGPGSPAEPAEVYRELDWYWTEHRWRRLGLRQTVALERRNGAVLGRHLREFHPDVVAWWPLGGMSLSLVERVRRAGVPAVFFVLDPWLHYGPQHDRWTRLVRRVGPAAGLLERLTGIPAGLELERAGQWVFCSQAMRDSARADGVRVTDGAVIHPGVESQLLESAPEAAPAPWRGRLLYLGRVVEQKGVHTAITALASCPPETTLRIVGAGDPAYERQLRGRAGELGVSDRLRMEGPVAREELAGVLRDADAIVFPVEWPEPFGLVPLESMAVGRPVIATGRGGSAEYLRAGVNCLGFPAGDAEALAAAVARLAGDPQLRERLRAAGRRTAEQFDEERFNVRAAAELAAALSARPGAGGPE